MSLERSGMVSGLPYIPSSWSRMSLMDMLAFRPIRAGIFGDLELVSNVLVKYAKACTFDIFV